VLSVQKLGAVAVLVVLALVLLLTTSHDSADAYRPGTVVRAIQFPANGAVTYRNDFGDCRGTNCSRRHEGNDLIGARMVPLVAAVDGTIDWIKVDDGVSTAGNAVSIKDAEGWRYVYIHLNNDTPGTDDGANPPAHRFAPGIEKGARVTKGQLIGWLGDSGNAETSTPHLHFEIVNPRGAAINPFASLRTAQGLRTSDGATPVDFDRCVDPTNPAYVDGSTAGTGYWVLGKDGSVTAFGDAPALGSVAGMTLNRPVVGMGATPTGKGYWEVATDGGIFSYGDAVFYGSTGSMVLNKPIVGMASTPSGKGYWLVASDGGIFSYGDAVFYGSTGSMVLNKPIVGMAPTPTGKGYWLLASDGGMFAFGDAVFFGSLPSTPAAAGKTALGMTPTATGLGYWLVTTDGNVYPYGDAVDHGSLAREGLCATPRAVGIARTKSGKGYAIVGADGSVWVYGDARWTGDMPDRGLVISGGVVSIAPYLR
jgi:hypothetical protein